MALSSLDNQLTKKDGKKWGKKIIAHVLSFVVVIVVIQQTINWWLKRGNLIFTSDWRFLSYTISTFTPSENDSFLVFFFLLFGLLWRREPFYACTRIFMGQHFLKFEMVSLFLYLKTYILISQLPISLKHHCSIIVGMLEWVWKSTGGKWYCWWYVLCLGCRCVRFA